MENECVCVLEAARMTDCHQEADSETKPGVVAVTLDEIERHSTGETDTAQSSDQDGCTVRANGTDGENSCRISSTGSVTQSSKRKRQRLCKSGSKCFRYVILQICFLT